MMTLGMARLAFRAHGCFPFDIPAIGTAIMTNEQRHFVWQREDRADRVQQLIELRATVLDTKKALLKVWRQIVDRAGPDRLAFFQNRAALGNAHHFPK